MPNSVTTITSRAQTLSDLLDVFTIEMLKVKIGFIRTDFLRESFTYNSVWTRAIAYIWALLKGRFN
jgi:hypothetical protein